jgi:hypothetical protein
MVIPAGLSSIPKIKLNETAIKAKPINTDVRLRYLPLKSNLKWAFMIMVRFSSWYIKGKTIAHQSQQKSLYFSDL